MSATAEARAPLLRARGLRFAWPDGTAALRGVDLEVGPGETIGLLGPNGSGKTTLLRVLATAARPSAGRLEPFPGEPPLPLAAVRRRTAVVFDRPPFVEALSGRENAARLLALRGRPRAEARASAARWLAAFGLLAEADRPVSSYSLGMRRKLALAEAFAAGPSLLLLDEPLIGLDPGGRAELVRALGRHAGTGGAAVLALHDAVFARRACDRVLFLHEGSVAAAGAPNELIRGLGRETIFEVETGGAAPAGPLPAGLQPVGRGDRELRAASSRGSAALPDLCAWLLEGGADVRAVRVREPGLEDVYLAVTGRSLDDGPDARRDDDS